MAVPRELHLMSICWQTGILLGEIKQPLSVNSDKANFQVGVLWEEIYSRNMRRRAQAQARGILLGGILKPIIFPRDQGGRPQEAKASMEEIHRTFSSTQPSRRR